MTATMTPRRFAMALACAIGLVGLPCAGAQAQAMLYTHNGSVMLVEQSGMEVRITYSAPRNGLRSEGVGPGTELFLGSVEDGYLSGLARIFRAGCGVLDYYIYGDFTFGQSFVLSGASPVLAPQGCAVVDNVYDGPNSNLVFVPGGPVVPNPAPNPQPQPGLTGSLFCVTGISAGSGLNLRTGPGLSYGRIGEIPAGTCGVEAGPTSGSWQGVRWQGRVGWVSQQYLREAQ